VFFSNLWSRWVGKSCPSELSHIQICLEDEGGSRISPIIWWLVGIYFVNMITLDFFLHNMVTWAHFFQKKPLCAFCTFLCFSSLIYEYFVSFGPIISSKTPFVPFAPSPLFLDNLWIFMVIWAHSSQKNLLCTFCTFFLLLICEYLCCFCLDHQGVWKMVDMKSDEYMLFWMNILMSSMSLK